MENHTDVSEHVGLNMNDKKSNAKRKLWIQKRSIMDDEREDINERADAFIKNFRNQLKIQRAESFKRFQDMISRGV